MSSAPCSDPFDGGVVYLCMNTTLLWRRAAQIRGGDQCMLHRLVCRADFLFYSVKTGDINAETDGIVVEGKLSLLRRIVGGGKRLFDIVRRGLPVVDWTAKRLNTSYEYCARYGGRQFPLTFEEIPFRHHSPTFYSCHRSTS